jgi:hypothetical protein
LAGVLAVVGLGGFVWPFFLVAFFFLSDLVFQTFLGFFDASFA